MTTLRGVPEPVKASCEELAATRGTVVVVEPVEPDVGEVATFVTAVDVVVVLLGCVVVGLDEPVPVDLPGGPLDEKETGAVMRSCMASMKIRSHVTPWTCCSGVGGHV